MRVKLKKCKPYKTAVELGETLREVKVVTYTDTGWKSRFAVAIKLSFSIDVEPPDEIEVDINLINDNSDSPSGKIPNLN